MGIPQSGFNIPVTQDVLQCLDLSAPHYKVTCKRMAQIVKSYSVYSFSAVWDVSFFASGDKRCFNILKRL